MHLSNCQCPFHCNKSSISKLCQTQISSHVRRNAVKYRLYKINTVMQQHLFSKPVLTFFTLPSFFLTICEKNTEELPAFWCLTVIEEAQCIEVNKMHSQFSKMNSDTTSTAIKTCIPLSLTSFWVKVSSQRTKVTLKVGYLSSDWSRIRLVFSAFQYLMG